MNNTDNMVNNNVEDGVFEVEKILRKKCINGKWLYRFKWPDFDAKNLLVVCQPMKIHALTYVYEPCF
jgi:hypothetical protein